MFCRFVWNWVDCSSGNGNAMTCLHIGCCEWHPNMSMCVDAPEPTSDANPLNRCPEATDIDNCQHFGHAHECQGVPNHLLFYNQKLWAKKKRSKIAHLNLKKHYIWQKKFHCWCRHQNVFYLQERSFCRKVKHNQRTLMSAPLTFI